MRLRFPRTPRFSDSAHLHRISATLIQTRFASSTPKARPTPQLGEMLLVFDFDGTITQKDTIAHLASGAVEYQLNKHGRDLTSTWNGVVQAYLDDYKQHEDEYRPSREDRCDISEEVKFVESLKDVETASLDRVEASGVFEGLPEKSLREMGMKARESGKITLRDGFEELCLLALKQGWGIYIISVNWSYSFIKGVLYDFPLLSVCANGFSMSGKVVGPMMLGRPLMDASGKLEVLKKLYSTNQRGGNIYFGDSLTDLLCLVDRNGIVIADKDRPSSLLNTLDRVGLYCPHVGSTDSSGYWKLSWARDFREVLESGYIEKAT